MIYINIIIKNQKKSDRLNGISIHIDQTAGSRHLIFSTEVPYNIM